MLELQAGAGSWANKMGIGPALRELWGVRRRKGRGKQTSNVKQANKLKPKHGNSWGATKEKFSKLRGLEMRRCPLWPGKGWSSWRMNRRELGPAHREGEETLRSTGIHVCVEAGFCVFFACESRSYLVEVQNPNHWLPENSRPVVFCFKVVLWEAHREWQKFWSRKYVPRRLDFKYKGDKWRAS